MYSKISELINNSSLFIGFILFRSIILYISWFAKHVLKYQPILTDNGGKPDYRECVKSLLQ